MVKQLLTPKQVARAIGVSESSLKRWCDRGLIPTVRTAGGHRRLPIQGVIQFLRQTQRPLLRPEMLGLPTSAGQSERVLARARQRLGSALVAGDDSICRTLLFDLYLSGQRLSVICDEVLATVFHELGDLWECGKVEIFEERRGCEICERALFELRFMLPPPRDPQAPRAIGAAIDGDPYRLPTRMVELVLRECGWNATSLGSSLPFATLRRAIDKTRPQLFWLSASSIADEQQFLQQYQKFYAEIGQQVPVVVGGRALTEPVRRQMKYAAYCDNLQHLEAFIATISSAKQGK